MDVPSHRKLAEEAKREQIKQLELTNEYSQQRKQALAEFAEFAEKIQSFETREKMGLGGDAAIDALHNLKAVGALKCLTTTMMRAVQFWKSLETHCNSISSMDMDNSLKKAVALGHERNRKVWCTPGFKRKAIAFFAKWVALESVCTVYGKKIKVTQGELYSSIRENPTLEQSRANMAENCE